MSRLQVLPFPFAGLLDFIDCGIEEVLGRCREVPPRFRRPGWYRDRWHNLCWYEFPDGKAYAADPEEFKFRLQLLDAEERPLTEAERAAVRTLATYRNCPVQHLAARLRLDDCQRQSRGCYRAAAAATAKALKDNPS